MIILSASEFYMCTLKLAKNIVGAILLMTVFSSEIVLADALCNWSLTNVRKELEALRAHKILFPPSFKIEPLDFSSSIDWKKYNSEKPSARWYLNNMTYLRPLLQSKISSDVLIAEDIMKSWYEANPIGMPASDFAWDGHAVALRSEQLACLKILGSSEKWVDAALLDHGQYLANPENYQGNWNHGLDQNIGLLYISAASKNNEWAELARTRSIEAIEVMVDWQSVSIEQAISYHHYNFVRMEEARRLFAKVGFPLPEKIFIRLQNMAEFLAHATMPNGRWIPIGDSSQVPLADTLSGSVADFAMSKGIKGTKPQSRFGLFQAGYMFARSGWGDEQPFDQEQYYSLRFGPARIIHGHNDHMSATFYSKGFQIIVDGGFHGYTDDKWRHHLRSPAAHNVVYTTDDANFYWNETTRLLGLTIEEKWQSYSLHDMPYHKTRRERNILFFQDPFEGFVVLDRVIGPSRNYEQAWHFADDFNVIVQPQGAIANKDDIVLDIQQLWPVDSLAIKKGQDSPPRGWHGYGVNDLRPTPVLLTSKSGDDISFLTVFILRTPSEKVKISQRPIRSNGVSRKVNVELGEKRVAVEILNNNFLRLVK